MIISRIFPIAAVIAALTLTPVCSAAGTPVSNGLAVNTENKVYDKKDHAKKHDEFRKDPIKALENRKAEIQSLVKEGKLTKEKADEITARLDSKIKEIQDFNKLTLQQKKDKLIKDCRTSLDRLIKEGKMDKAKADTIFEEYLNKVKNWDGNGYPHFRPKCFGGKHKKFDTDGR